MNKINKIADSFVSLPRKLQGKRKGQAARDREAGFGREWLETLRKII